MGCSGGGACFGPCPIPGGIGMCGSIPFCFSADTKMIILDNNKQYKRAVSEIKKGDLVLTFDGKEKVFSKVNESTKNEGIFEFYEIKVKDENSNCKTISVTGNHTMIVFAKDYNIIKLNFACELKVGEVMRTLDGLFEIYEINHEMKNDSYKIVLEKGIVLANDILVTTVYLEGKNNAKECKRLIDSAKIPLEIKN